MEELKAEIVRITETFRIDDAGSTQKVVVVLWRLGKHGPFSFELPEAAFAGNLVKAEVEKRAAAIRAAFEP